MLGTLHFSQPTLLYALPVERHATLGTFRFAQPTRPALG